MESIAVNYWAVLVAAAVNFTVGVLWYGPLFGKTWMALEGITPEGMKSMKLTPAQAMALGFISTLVMAFVLGHFANVWNAMGVAGAFALTFWVWLGFIVTTLAGSVLWEGKSLKLFLLNIVYQFIALFASAFVLVYWK